MKTFVTICACLGFATSVMACELTGIKGSISDDGRTITSRQMILLKDQARSYGGYERAAGYMEQNRLNVMQNAAFSQAVKDQVNSDMLKNTQDLKCWAEVCKKNSNDPACQF